MESLTPPLFMGVTLNATSGFRPAAQFLVRTPLTAAQVGLLYAQQTQSEAEESTEIRFVAKRRLLHEIREVEEGDEEEEEEEEEETSSVTWKELAPNAQGCLMVARKLLS